MPLSAARHRPDTESAAARPDIVRIRSLTRSFGGPNILDGLDLDIADGAFVALLGRSGSGKSTLLRTLAGLDSAPAGTVAVPSERTVVFQEPRLLPWQSVWRNVALGLSGPDARDRAVAALQEVGLSHRIDAWPLTLSGGEAQRTALARALVREPRLLLLDEPFAALDALTRMRMQGLVGSLWQAHRPAVLLVTHDVDEALLLADRVLVLAEGRIATDIPVALDRPRRHGDPGFVRLRSKLLADLGVDEFEGEAAPAAHRPAGRPVPAGHPVPAPAGA
ncbi:ABC transporter ATP-binding protein [Inquilinus limosus]|uniref:ABC transporter ATP-binding protein n=1 Tax=Inquilinus limosus TaxID=171674 RepID=UPI003F1732E5